MTLQEIEQQVLNLSPADKRHLIQFLSESLIPSNTAHSPTQPSTQNLAEFLQNSPLAEALASGELDLSRDKSLIPDRVNL